MTDFLYSLIANHGTTFAAWVAGLLALVLSKFVLVLIKSQKARDIASRSATEVGRAVRDVWQTYVSDIKAGREDGKLTEDEKIKAKSDAIAKAKSYLGMKGLAALAHALGMDDVESWLATQVEVEVDAAKKAGNAAGQKTTGTAVSSKSGPQ
jgi:hypothetical protein